MAQNGYTPNSTITIVGKGAPTDVAFLSTPPDGQPFVDEDTGLLYVRVKGAWVGQPNLFNPVVATGIAALDTPALQSAINIAAGGGRIRPFPGSYAINAALTVASPCTVDLTGVTITQVTAGAKAIVVTSSNVDILKGKIVGAQFANNVDGERGIDIHGATWAGAIANVNVVGTEVRNFGGYGIFHQYLTDYTIRDCYVHDIWYGAIVGLSPAKGKITGNEVKNVIGSLLAYGIVVSRFSNATDSLVLDPLPADILMANNVINGVVNWEGMDCHGGFRITFANNVVSGCSIGIHAGSGQNFAGVGQWATSQFAITGNIIDSLLTDGTAQAGIIANGIDSVAGTRTAPSMGTITGNVITGHGNEAQVGAQTGGIFMRDTEGVVVAGNTIMAPAPHGINLFKNNFDYTLLANTIIDPWTNTGTQAVGIMTGLSSYTQGVIVGNQTATTGNIVATHVLDYGIRMGTDVNTFAVVIGNASTSATPLNDASHRTLSGLYGIQLAQPARLAQLTDNSGGASGGNTIAAITTGGASADQTATRNAIATLAAKVNALELLVHNAGIEQ